MEWIDKGSQSRERKGMERKGKQVEALQGKERNGQEWKVLVGMESKRKGREVKAKS